ncbi:MAG: phosphotransferase [Mesorhizobium sp.]
MRSDLVIEAIGLVPGWADRPIVIEPAIPVLASPSWRGVDGDSLIARDTENGSTLFIKAIHEDTAFYIDVAASFDAATKAGEAGVGPRVILADPARRVMITEDLSADWRVAGLEACRDPAFIDRVFEARARFASVAPLLREADVFADIKRFHELAVSSGAAMPADTAWLVDTVLFAAAQIGPSKASKFPIHGDGNVSNILKNKNGDVLLVDWDRAGNGDLMEDTGSFLVEAFPFEPEARDAFRRNHPGLGEGAFERAAILGVADDLLWGLIASIQAHVSERRVNEFYKFANWRLLRARMAVREPRFGEHLRRAA